jgi:hypothetical protein
MAMSLRSAWIDARASAVPQARVNPSAAGIWAVGRIEARRMLLHPAFLIGAAFGVLMLRGAFGIEEGGMSLSDNIAWIVSGLLLGSFMGTVLTANVAALRSRRDHTRELFGAFPAPPETRTAGLFVGLALGPVLASIVLVALAWLPLRAHPDIGPHVDLFLAVQVPLTVAALGALGIAVGRWVPSLLGGPIVIAASLLTPLVWLVPWIVPRSTGVDPTMHLVYLVSAICTWVALALARDRRTVLRFAMAAGAFAIGIVAATAQVPAGGFW